MCQLLIWDNFKIWLWNAFYIEVNKIIMFRRKRLLYILTFIKINHVDILINRRKIFYDCWIYLRGLMDDTFLWKTEFKHMEKISEICVENQIHSTFGVTSRFSTIFYMANVARKWWLIYSAHSQRCKPHTGCSQ